MTQIKYNFYLRSSAFICVLFLLFLPTAVHAQPSATVTADRTTLTVGDPVQITVRISHPPGARVHARVQPIDPDWGDFELLQTADPLVASQETTLRFTVTLWAPGEYELPPLRLTIETAGGQTLTAVSDPLPLTVESVLAPDDLALRDIRPQAALPPAAVWWPWLLLIAGVIGGGTAVWWTRRPASRTAAAHNQIRRAALDALDALPPHPGVAALATAILHILRRFLQQAYAIPAAYRTSGEIAAALPHTPLPPAQQETAIDLLRQIDQARFDPAAPQTAVSLTTAARHFIQTAPLPGNMPNTAQTDKHRAKSVQSVQSVQSVSH